MSGDRELDTVMAEWLGWHGPVAWVEDQYGRDPYMFEPRTPQAWIDANDQNHNCIVPRYSAKWGFAGKVVEKLKELGYRVVISCSARDARCEVWHRPGTALRGELVADAYEATGPLAVCVAARQVIEREREAAA